jgi:ribosomal-protein-alanine N-acetyltransferase
MFETDRLIVRTLSAHELKLYAASSCELAKEWNVRLTKPELESETREAIFNDLLPKVDDPEKEFLFYTMWLMIEKTTQTIVGSFCFHGEPEDGTIEIGYGTDEEFRNKGYMTEALGGVLRWASGRTDIQTILAETEFGNDASIRMLEKLGFVKSEIKTNTFMYSYTVHYE